MVLQETILCATAPLSSSAGPGSISFHNIQTGVTLASFKQTNAASNCTAVCQSNNTQGGFILASQHDKSILNVYNFQKDQISLKIVLPEKLTCIATDRQGEFCAGGTAAGRIYLWEVASGIMYNSWDAHYRQVNVLTFTNDGSALLSGSGDSGVSVWSVSRLLDDGQQNDLPIPYCILSDHTLPVTDIKCGVGPFPNCRVLTASVDHSVKLWDLFSKSLLTTFQFPHPISHIAWDVTERIFFAAATNGAIHQVNMFRQRESKFGGQAMEAIGGAGVSDIIRIEDDSGESRKRRLISVKQPISALAISLTSSILLCGTSDGLIHQYDIPSHQQLRTISTHKGFSISTLATMLKPPDLFGHVNLDLKVGNATDVRDTLPVKHVAPFQKVRDLKSREAHNVPLLLPNLSKNYLDETSIFSSQEFLKDHAFFVQPSTSALEHGIDQLSQKSRVSELEAEVEQLRSHLSRAKSVNDVMWESVVKNLVSQKEEDAEEMDGEEVQRVRKRGRGVA